MAVARYKDYACKQGGKLMIAGDTSLHPLSASKKKVIIIEPGEQSICSKA